MKLTGAVRPLTLMLLIGGSALMYSQDERDARPTQDEARPVATKPAHDAMNPAKPEDAKPPKQEEAKPQPNDNARPANNDARPKDMKPAAQAPAEAGRNAQQRQAGRIPDDKFRANFGRSHTVVIHQPVVVEGQPRFQFGGYWFGIAAPWPVGWAYTDQCYIDYVDGEYVLIDLLHPGMSVALIVVM